MAASLMNPSHVTDLHEKVFPGGRSEVWGHATYGGIRVNVTGQSRNGRQVKINGEQSLTGLANREDDGQMGWCWGDVDFEALERFWLVRTSHFDAVDGTTPLPGMTTVVDGTEFGVTDTCGTVSLAGVRQLQLIWLGVDAPAGDDWVLDGYGCWTTLVERSLVDEVRHVEWTAIWRDITVLVTGIHNDRAHISVISGGVPEFETPEVRHTVSLRNCWSAVVPIEELSLRSWRSEEHHVGAGVLAGTVGFVRGRTAVLIRPKDWDGSCSGIVAVKDRGQTVTPDFIMHPLDASSRTPPVEWRASVVESDITDLRLIASTTQWRGELVPVQGASQTDDTLFVDRIEAPRPETSEPVCTAVPSTADALPERALAMAGQYRYREHRFG
ncbi:hypothetical protein [Cryobacterium sp. AP23]